MSAKGANFQQPCGLGMAFIRCCILFRLPFRCLNLDGKIGSETSRPFESKVVSAPICSMYRIFTNIYHQNDPVLISFVGISIQYSSILQHLPTFTNIYQHLPAFTTQIFHIPAPFSSHIWGHVGSPRTLCPSPLRPGAPEDRSVGGIQGDRWPLNWNQKE